MFHLFLILPCSLCLLDRSLIMTVMLFLILIFATFRIVALVTWLALASVIVIHNIFESLTDFVFLPLRPPVLSALLVLRHLRHHLFSGIIV
jgi:disulfide bond formation protein DsbB